MMVNPVLRRELLRRFRRRRATVVLTGFLLALSLIMFGLHEIGQRILESQASFLGADAAFLRPSLGRFMVESVLATLMGLVLLAAPGFAAGQIAGERERGSLPLLQATLLSPTQIVLGKLWASTAWVGLLVMASLPLVAISSVFGGVEAVDVLLGLVTVLLVGLAMAGMALGVSAVVKRTTGAVVVSYAVVLTMLLGTGFVALLIGVVGRNVEDALVVLYANPFVALAGAVNTAALGGGAFDMPTPLTPFAYVYRADEFNGGLLAQDAGRSADWLWSLAVVMVIGLIGLAIAIRRMRLARPHRSAPVGAFRASQSPAAPPPVPAVSTPGGPAAPPGVADTGRAGGPGAGPPSHWPAPGPWEPPHDG